MFLKEAPLGRVVPLFCSVIPCEKRVRHFVFVEPSIETSPVKWGSHGFSGYTAGSKSANPMKKPYFWPKLLNNQTSNLRYLWN